MRYVSTRGRAPERAFTDILLSGLADDGGLYVPTHYPSVSREQLDAWRTLSYADLATEIIALLRDGHSKGAPRATVSRDLHRGELRQRAG